ncbi:unnamed protein product [Vitrella brassicaformis CCMP3155]|uniref:AB hydrolase-1 domain-containing protein n=1 Tax=Vitrella brassicaformis (strain CCMP3155) TaxID=1169540 RepID=A0A0G4F3B4_VITBC|nr:unnamed protein product [Vitrella brassicaformis CCMP3155]|eukprot:CEM05853.1 unnamed protein product [Vitrella brassicaformis CCMP3155]
MLGLVVGPPVQLRLAAVKSVAAADKMTADVSTSKGEAVLSTGVVMSYLRTEPAVRDPRKPPLVFVHGSFHGAWCWAEHWMPYFSQLGYECIAINLRGTSGTPVPASEEEIRSIKIERHVEDVADLLRKTVPDGNVVLIGHSFGSMTILKLLEQGLVSPKGVALACSVPPSGNGPMTVRFILRSVVDAVQIVRGFVFKQAMTSCALARQLFFDSDMPEEKVEAYRKLFCLDGQIGLDVRSLSGSLPSRQALPSGRASWLDESLPRLVMGTRQDYIVDGQGVEETARFLGTDAVMLDGVPHDVMLASGDRWRAGAEAIAEWLEGKVVARAPDR